MEEILILGNGISRLTFEKQIREWPGILWACNRAYLDFGSEIDGLAGHIEVLKEAEKYRNENNLNFKLLGTHEQPFISKPIYHKDTGTTLVAEALTRKMKVNVVGFDLGGLDVYSPGHEKKNKTTWINRWRMILREFGSNNINFWGYDHKTFLLSNRHPSEYAKEYMKGKPHIHTDEYDNLKKEWGNDYSRIYDLLPHVLLRNIGNRQWTFAECETMLDSGNAITIPECVANKYVELYPGEFRIEPLPKIDNGIMIDMEE